MQLPGIVMVGIRIEPASTWPAPTLESLSPCAIGVLSEQGTGDGLQMRARPFRMTPAPSAIAETRPRVENRGHVQRQHRVYCGQEPGDVLGDTLRQ